MKQIFVLLLALSTSYAAQAQDIGLVAGIANTSADVTGSDINAEIGYRLGVAVRLDLVDQFYFRTGGTYTYRPFNVEDSSGTDLDVKMSYIDIPALFQYKLNDRIAFYAGPVVGLNVGEKAEGQIGSSSVSGDLSDLPGQGKTKSIYLLAQAGVNFDFDGIGFDLFYERGLGDINKGGAKDYSILGANFVMWF